MTGSDSIMLPSVPVELFVMISELVQLPSPTIFLREEESLPMDLCLGGTFAVTCLRYGAEDIQEIHEHLVAKYSRDIPRSPLFVSGGDHQQLLMKLKKDSKFFASNHVWILPLEISALLPLRLDSRVLSYRETNGTPGSEAYAVYESYAVKGGSPIHTLLFKWSPAHKEKRPASPNFLDNRKNLQGVTLLNSWFKNPPFVKFIQGPNPDSVGFYVDVLKALKSQLNFTTESVAPRKGKWGRPQGNNGSWSGVVGMLHDGEIDISAVGTLMNVGRHGVVDFLWPLFSKQVTLLSKSATKPKLNAWAYVDMFPLGAWVVGAVFLLVAGVMFAVASGQSIPQGMTLMARLFLPHSAWTIKVPESRFHQF